MKYILENKDRIAAFFAVLLIFSIPVASCNLNENNNSLNLAPIPYEFLADEDLIKHLAVEELTGEWASEVTSRGGEGVLVTYQPEIGEPSIFMGVYYFPEAAFLAAQNPNEPPMFGSEVINKDEKILAIAGPHDSMFDPATQDGQNINRLYELIYLPESYR